jgi:EAL domain-containing protein (putative c-di-GMP-specific phosphodiesterase class I)
VPATEPPTDAEIVGDLLQQGLDVAYQPIIDLATDDVIGWEALLRGRLPVHGTVSPEAVVGSATRVGALDPVMRQVTEQALSTATVASVRLSRPMTVTINLEPEQLRAGSQFLRWLVDRTASCPARLVVEITERGREEAWGREQDDALDRLTAGGLALAIDDLGAGTSRMQQLARHEWAWVKLDRSFLQVGERGRILLRHSVAMLHDLGSRVVLEGIETSEHLEIARLAGADLAQGILLGEPIPSDRVLATLPPVSAVPPRRD